MPRESGVSHAKLIQFGRAYVRTLLKMRRLKHNRTGEKLQPANLL
jgi:hypothetical protein